MKRHLLAPIVGLLTLAGANAATITLTNFDGTNYGGIVGAGDTILTSGFAAVGTFATDPTAIGDVASFVQFGNSLAVGANSFISGDINGALTAGDSFVGNTVYVVVGNGADVGTSSEFLIWKATSNPAGNTFFADDPIGGPGDVNLQLGTGSVLVGGTSSADFGLGAQSSFQLAAIPEPTVAILGSLGILGLLRRRR